MPIVCLCLNVFLDTQCSSGPEEIKDTITLSYCFHFYLLICEIMGNEMRDPHSSSVAAVRCRSMVEILLTNFQFNITLKKDKKTQNPLFFSSFLNLEI